MPRVQGTDHTGCAATTGDDGADDDAHATSFKATSVISPTTGAKPRAARRQRRRRRVDLSYNYRELRDQAEDEFETTR